MARLDVLDVGDGASSVFRDDPSHRWGRPTWSWSFRRGRHTSVLDCGSCDLRAKEAAARLLTALSPAHLAGLSSFVVTHFDADHWAGLQHVPESLRRGHVPDEIPLFYPRVPFGVSDRLPAGVMAMISATSPTGMDPLTLRSAWAPISHLRFCPVARGDTVWLARKPYEVLWPPVSLDDDSTRRLNNLVQEISDLAELLRRRGYPQLSDAIKEAYADALPGHVDDAGEPPFEDRPRPQDPRHLVHDDDMEGWYDEDGRFVHPWYEEPRRLEVLERIALPESPDDDGDSGHAPVSETLNSLYFPKDMEEEIKKLAKRARRANNDLSLVFHDPENGSLAVFGDAPTWAVETVCDSGALPAYQVVLAPHHGTHEVPLNFPQARTCVSQQGRRGYLWNRHLDTHANSGECVSTARSGTQTFR